MTDRSDVIRVRMVAVAVALAGIASAEASPQSQALTSRGFELAHNLDQDEALDTFRKAVAADPNDPAAHRAIAAIAWLKILFQRGVVTFDDYLGPMNTPRIAMKAAPSDLASLFQEHIERALTLADARLIASPTDPDAHYQVGATVGLLASYSGTVDGRVVHAVRAARRAFAEHEKVLALDSRRKDAALFVGLYRYGVSNLSLPMRLLAYAAGFGGGRERGIALIEEAAKQRQDVHTDPLFTLMVIYNREGRHDDAWRVLKDLQRVYPRNRLLWLNAGATALLSGRFADAEAVLDDGMVSLARDSRPRAFGEEAVWKYKRGAARLARGRPAAAEADFIEALRGDARDWVRGRIHAERGKLADLAGDRKRALAEYERARALGETDNDPIGVQEARRLIRSPYRNRP